MILVFTVVNCSSGREKKAPQSQTLRPSCQTLHYNEAVLL